MAAAVAALALLAFTTPSAQPQDILSPAVSLGAITVANGTATISGNVGVPNSNVQLSINGQPLSVDAAGNFSGAINLDGQSKLTLSLRNGAGEVTSVTIPLNTNVVGPGGVIGPEILDALKKAAVSILKPLDGFKIQDQLPLKLEGSVADKGSLASLTVNGQDALGLLGTDRTFSMLLPGLTREVSVTATDHQGVSQTSTVPVLHASSMFTTPVGRSVAAKGALGIRIAKIRYITKNVRRTKRLRMVVTIRDRRGLLIRGATIRVRSKYARRIVRNPRVKKTNRVGQAAFLMRARNRAFGKRLLMVTLAKTPTAKASKASSVRIPKLKRAVARRR
ncbi:MAG TPA: hypothetical protein VG144_04315 [Gaiellaceae bacterium]|nr:hypothetical protein [Gaiellaceae bacterium]